MCPVYILLELTTGEKYARCCVYFFSVSFFPLNSLSLSLPLQIENIYSHCELVSQSFVYGHSLKVKAVTKTKPH